MAVTLSKPMAEHQQRQAVGYLQEALKAVRDMRQKNEPGMLEMQIYYLLSELRAVPESYEADWPVSLMK